MEFYSLISKEDAKKVRKWKVAKWDTNFHKISPRSWQPNAKKFGLVVIDFNGKYRTKLLGGNKATPMKELSIPFQFIEQIPVWTKAANYNEISDIVGRFETIPVYSNSGAQTISLNLIYYAYGSKALNLNSKDGRFWNIEDINVIINKIKSLVYPTYDRGYTPPPRLALNIASFFPGIPVIVQSVSVEETEPFDTETLDAITKKVTIECRTDYGLYESIDAKNIFNYNSYIIESGIGSEIIGYENFG